MGVATNPKAPPAPGGLGRLLKVWGRLDGLEGDKAEDTPGGGTVTVEGAAGLTAPGYLCWRVGTVGEDPGG